MAFKALMIGHFLGDFFFQSNNMAGEKNKKISKLIEHCFIYFITIYLMIIGFTEMNQWSGLLAGVLAVSIIHGIIDWTKCKIKRQNKILQKKEYIIFIVDQLLHIVVLFALWQFMEIKESKESLLLSRIDIATIEVIITQILAILICWKPASVFIVSVFSAIPETTEKSGSEEEVRIGSWIGILEREIILILGLLNQFGAIGFVLTAKSLARYKQLENKAFAEKYLVGTLLSSIIAIVCIVICKF